MFHFIQCIATFIHMYFDAQDEQLDVIYLVIDIIVLISVFSFLKIILI